MEDAQQVLMLLPIRDRNSFLPHDIIFVQAKVDASARPNTQQDHCTSMILLCTLVLEFGVFRNIM